MPPSESESQAFDRLHPAIQRWIWQQHWTELRDIQERAIPAVLSRKRDLVISAATAGGKTEAAFLPILSAIAGQPGPGFRVLAVSPLKALINDQSRRLDEIAELVDIPVHRWHGDVAASRKESAIRNPSGILLITPESLEALFIRRGPAIPRLFGSLAYVVVDELHAFLGSERGRQLQSLLHRVEATVGRRIMRIGLSATLGEMDRAGQFLRSGGSEVLVSEDDRQDLKLQVRGYIRPESIEDAEDDASALAIAAHLYTVVRGSDHLVFANSRNQVERYADLLGGFAERDRLPNTFYAHHGNLSRELRETAEAALKDPSRAATAVCTSTLELGIDIGTVASIGQIGPPPSVASMRQRLGRSGRRGDPAVLRVYIQESELSGGQALSDQLRAGLVQTIAMVELLIQRWYEPPLTDALHFSTLIQQVLSVIAERGGESAPALYRLLCASGPWVAVTTGQFANLLRALGAAKILTQDPAGTLLLDLDGEHLVNSRDFYAAFQTPEEYRIVHAGRDLGTIPIEFPLTEDSRIVFAGRRWRVVRVVDEEKVIEVEPTKGGKPPRFGGTVGTVHDRVRQAMFRFYLADVEPPYLDHTAADLLAEGRATFRQRDLAGRYLVDDSDGTLILPWAGDRISATLTLLLQRAGLRADDDGLLITVADSAPATRLAIHRLLTAPPIAAVDLAARVANSETEKHDPLLPPDLLAAGYASRDLDTDGAYAILRRIGQGLPPGISG